MSFQVPLSRKWRGQSPRASSLLPAHSRRRALGAPSPAGAFICVFLSPPQLLDYVMTTLLFSDKNVDSNLIAWNRVVLLHGKARRVPCDETSSVTKALPVSLCFGEGL